MEVLGKNLGIYHHTQLERSVNKLHLIWRPIYSWPSIKKIRSRTRALLKWKIFIQIKINLKIKGMGHLKASRYELQFCRSSMEAILVQSSFILNTLAHQQENFYAAIAHRPELSLLWFDWLIGRKELFSRAGFWH